MDSAYLHTHGSILLLRLSEHIVLSSVAVCIAAILGILLGIGGFQYRPARLIILPIVSALQTVPSLALLALLLVLLHSIGALPAIIALSLYALLPIVRGTLEGLRATSPPLVEAATAMGMTSWQQLRYLRLPLAMPQLIASLRVATVLTVGIATIAAFIGAGGLGQLINRGLFLSDSRLILLGALPAAFLALLLDGLIALIQYGFQGRGKPWRWLAVTIPVMLISWGSLYSWFHAPMRAKETVRIGSKNFTEQLVLGEILAQTLEQQTNLVVERRFSLGGSLLAHRALLEGEIDLYVEYSGTALASIFRQPVAQRDVYHNACTRYAALDIHCLPPLGFNNTYVFLMKTKDAQTHHITAISDLKHLAPYLRAAFDFEFAGRPDGYPRLRKKLGVHFASLVEMEPTLMYEALQNGIVDIIAGYATDGRIDTEQLLPLKDDVGFFPPYEAFIVVRGDFLRSHPEAVSTLRHLSGKLNDTVMRRLNAAVDQKKQDISEIATTFVR